MGSELKPAVGGGRCADGSAARKGNGRRWKGVGTAPSYRAISNNIAEGAGQQSPRQFVKYLEIALSSAHEVDSQLELARAIGVVDPREARKLQELTWEVKRMLTAFHRAVKRRTDEDDRDSGDRQ